MPTFSLEEDEQHIIDSLRNDNDRTIAIVCGSILEARLEDKIKAQLRTPHNKDSQIIIDDVFQGFGPLTSFSSQIRLGYLLKLYDYQVREELSSIKWIRNQFAHKKEAITFDTEDISRSVSKLKLIEKHIRPMSEYNEDTPIKEGISYTANPDASYNTPKWRFISTFGMYTRVFSTRIAAIGPIWGDGPKS
jgi:hypothetical protein